eukprot:16307414-Heterocapsa_arctica.AAC.1
MQEIGRHHGIGGTLGEQAAVQGGPREHGGGRAGATYHHNQRFHSSDSGDPQEVGQYDSGRRTK